MKIEHIQAVLDAAARTLGEMECSDVQLDGIQVVDESFRMADSSIVSIGVNGGMVGSLVLAFSIRDAASLASAVAQTTISPDDAEDICEGMAELANMIASNIASNLYGLGVKIGITTPTISTDPDVDLDFLGDAQTVLTPIVSSRGHFDLLLSLRDEPAGQ